MKKAVYRKEGLFGVPDVEVSVLGLCHGCGSQDIMGVGTREATQSFSVQDRTDRKRKRGGRARQSVDLSICQSVNLSIRYTLQ